jgi:hypothetical protein
MAEHDPGDISIELLRRRGLCSPWGILLHHDHCDETGEIVVWVRLILEDSREVFGFVSIAEAEAIEAMWGPRVKWFTRVTKPEPLPLDEYEIDRRPRLLN